MSIVIVLHMANKMKPSKFSLDTDKILLECLANIQKSMRDYQRDIADTIEDLKFSMTVEQE